MKQLLFGVWEKKKKTKELKKKRKIEHREGGPILTRSKQKKGKANKSKLYLFYFFNFLDVNPNPTLLKSLKQILILLFSV